MTFFIDGPTLHQNQTLMRIGGAAETATEDVLSQTNSWIKYWAAMQLAAAYEARTLGGFAMIR